MRVPRAVASHLHLPTEVHLPHVPRPHLGRPSALAVLCPPLAVAWVREWDHLLLNVLLTLCLWVPGVVHALWLVERHHPPHHADYDPDRVVAALRNHLRR